MITVGDLRKIIKGIPSNVVVVLGIGESVEDICAANVKVIMIKYNDTGEKEPLLVLPVCTCELDEPELEIGDINSQPELN